MENLKQRIPSVVYKRITDAKYDLLSAQRDLQMVSRQFLSVKKHRLELMQQRLNDALPEKQLARGYSITLKDGKAVKDASALREGDEVVTVLYRGKINSIICHSEHLCHSERSEESENIKWMSSDSSRCSE